MSDGSKRVLLRRIVLGGAGIAAVCGVVWLIAGESAAEKAPSGPPVVPVSVVVVERRDVPHTARGIGTVQPLASVTLRPQVEGVLTEVLFREGQVVEKGTLLAKIDDRAIVARIAQAEAQKMKSEAQLQSAKLDLERYQNLVKDEAISRQTVEQQVATVAQLSAAVRADEATIAAAKVDHSFTRIVAPITGRIGFRRVDAGNVVRPSDPEGLLTITQLAPISIVFTLPQEMLSQIQPLLLETGGAPVTAFDREAGSELAAGKLSMIDNAIDTNTGTFRLRAEFTNENHPLWPGQFATVELRTGVSRDVVVVPARAVQRGLDGPYVYRVVEGKAELVRVEIAFEDDEVAIVREGLARGETVISDGHSRVKPGAKVKVIEPPKGPGLGRPVT